MSKIVTETAEMQCDKGSTIAKLKVTSQSKSKATGLLFATEQDNNPIENIPAFGACTIKKKCQPDSPLWKELSLHSINGMKQLTDASFCMCAIGGKITFTTCGQSGFVTSE
ncbi:DUF4280 domain-containing protein [Chitinophagaceae bacterium LWZ2-11]